MINYIECPFCGKIVTRTYLRRGVTEYTQWGRGKKAIKQWYHATCFDKYIADQKARKSKE